jgi:hypothetical protein
MRKMGLVSLALIVAGIAPAPGSGRLARAQAGAGSSKASAAPVALDACALLTPQEAAAAFGRAVKQPKASRTIASSLGPGIDTAVSTCTYDTGTRDMTLSVHHTTDAAAGRLRQMIQMVCRKKEAIPGLGDVACWYSPAHDELQAAKGATFLTVEVKSGGAGEAIKSVAKTALARLPR